MEEEATSEGGSMGRRAMLKGSDTVQRSCSGREHEVLGNERKGSCRVCRLEDSDARMRWNLIFILRTIQDLVSFMREN